MASIFLNGCQSPYSSEGLMGGYSEMKMSDNSYRVSYAGNDYISFKKIRARAKLRAGEVASINGFDYLGFGKSESYRRRGVTYTVNMYRYDQDVNFQSEGKVVCKVESKDMSKSEAEAYVRNKISSCLGSQYFIVSDIPKIYGYGR